MNIMEFLCNTLCMEESYILKFSSTSPHRYKTYKIPKRNSKEKRIIAQPSKELKFFQRLLISHFEDVFQIHDCAFAYRSNLGIKDNATKHQNTKYLLKMDFKGFFPSITPELLFFNLERNGIKVSEVDKLLLRNLLFWREYRNDTLKLSIGAPSSPMISNFILYYFDEKVELYCEKKSIVYTRYADDLTFSTNKKEILFDTPNIIKDAIREFSNGCIKINNKKTIFSSKGHNRHVTGITLTNENTLSIGRERKRIISSMIHKFIYKLLDQKSILKLQGHLSFAVHIEPNFYTRMCKKYGKDNIEKVKKFKIE